MELRGCREGLCDDAHKDLNGFGAGFEVERHVRHCWRGGRLEADRDDALAQCRLATERARYEAQRAERRYRAVDAENRLVARGLESEWEQRLRELERAKAELARRERERPRALSAEDRCRLLALGADLQSVWEASTTTARDRKELLRTLLEEVIVTVFKAQHRARLTLRWRGGSLTDIDVDLPRQKPAIVRTDEDTIALVRRLAACYPDAVIAGILNRQDRHTAFTVTALPPTMSAVCGGTGTSRASSRPLPSPRASC